MRLVTIGLLIGVSFLAVGLAQQPSDSAAGTKRAAAAQSEERAKDQAKGKGKRQRIATGIVAGENKATPVERIKVAKGFRAELLYSVPATEQGSWVNLCVDDKGRII